MGRYLLLLLLLANNRMPLHAQNLSFTAPIHFLQEASADRAIDIVRFKDSYFVAWKNPGNPGGVHVCYLGKHQDTAFTQAGIQVDKAATNCAPVLQALNDRLYLLWIAADGALKYILNNTDTSFDAQNIYTAPLTGGLSLALGFTTTDIHDQLMLAAHANDKSSLVYALLEPRGNGQLQEAELKIIDNKKAAEYPAMARLTDTDVRICWRGYKGQEVYYADYNIHNGTWGAAIQLQDATAGAAPALCHVTEDRQFFLWKGAKNDNRIYYAIAASGAAPSKAQVLPPYFATPYPVAVCEVDGNNFIMAYTGPDQRLYLSYFAGYDPASWMQDLLYPARAEYTLKDIVIPGAHDAGMSILNGTGGQMKDAINSCNTLTQRQPIRDQLQDGIRMFDLRVGVFQQRLFIKHAESDCDEDAVGAGYGEPLADVLNGVRAFLDTNKMETVILTFSHFCDKDLPPARVADTIAASLGARLHSGPAKKLQELPLKELAGKVIVVFERFASRDAAIDSNTIADASGAFINFRRKYAATNDIKKLLAAQELFFNGMKEGVKENDLVRLDWQLTQNSQEAALICNGYRPDRTGAVVSGVILLTNALKKNETILDLSARGNRYLLPAVNQWIANGTINKKNKPNILYVDVAGSWITDYCIDLNNSDLYHP
ncbi:hypothetical protein F0L74_10425 [Chitinophaga agrisoli]|uniref:1-phosphatidylinositol phosphodiesterase n=1 Tax=Chitinophaga agrisoli TaxID=2607653 RepID=A0A5B2VX82_9BACT|nr:phosphatidylinositol-specific phospholipase C domain-containing protein [Chitinophaga agrisoli]KAA2242932.1 hypothetical protein F0L74_10425 [Chitinophaga agrisoli]